MHVSGIDIAIEAETAVLRFADASAGDIRTRIGAHAASLVHHGDTLQSGIATVPAAVAGALTSHRRLRLHGGMLPLVLRTLWEAGAMDRDARITTGVVLGDSTQHDFVERLQPLWLADVAHTHDVMALAAIPCLFAIDGAVDRDLFGQVNSEPAGGVIQAGAGGLPAFAQGALPAPGGRLLICLPATARRGEQSRIVAALDAQALCTLPRYLADVVVTEHGVAQLRGLSLDGRAQALIDIAAPQHRAALAAAWDELRRKA